MWKCLILLLLAVAASSLAQGDSDTVDWPSLTTNAAPESAEKKNLGVSDNSTQLAAPSADKLPIEPKAKDEPKETAAAKKEDPMQSKICQTCSCQDDIPFLVDCSNKALKVPFLFTDWPTDGLNSSIEARFDGNEFEEITQFPELPLIKLTFRKNSIKLIQKAAFKFLKSLEYLDLSENALTHDSIGGNVFEGQFSEDDYQPLQLKTLRLGYNQIHSIDKDAFNHLSTHLETLELNNNPLSVIDHQTAIAITTLRKLKVYALTPSCVTNN